MLNTIDTLNVAYVRDLAGNNLAAVITVSLLAPVLVYPANGNRQQSR
jgi:hypothetical protein